jgi:hypothetical protein
MKKIVIHILLLMLVYTSTAQGKYTGSMKKLVGQTFTDSKNIPALKTWMFREGSINSPLTDPVRFMVDVFQKGTTYIVFFSMVEDSVQVQPIILDVVEIKNVQPGWEIKSSLCREYKQDNAFIVALIKPGKGEYSTNVKKAWFFNRDKQQFEWKDPKKVDCLNEGQD